MTVTDRADAPAPSPYEQEQIDRFGIFEAEERVVEEVARAIHDDWCVQGCAIGVPESDYRAARAAVAAYRGATQDGGEASCPHCRAERADYEGPGGAWLPTCPNCGSSADPTLEGTQDGGAEEAVRRVEALADELGFLVDDETVDQVARVSHAWTLHRLRAALAPQAGDAAR